MAVCDAAGVRFVYPEGWELSQEEHGRDLTFHLQTGGTAFWSLTLLSSKPAAAEAVEAVVQAFQDEYPEVDVYDGPDLMLEGPAAGCEIDFVYLDMVNSAVVRAEATSAFTAVMVYQAEQREFEGLQPEFEAIGSSLRYANDDEAPGLRGPALGGGHAHDHDHDQGHHHHDCGHDHDHG